MSSSSSPNNTQAKVDDRDPRIVFKGTPSWFPGGVSQEYNTTETGTFTKGNTATFQFNGTGIEVYGTIPTNNQNAPPLAPSSALFVLDNDSAVLWTASVVSTPTFQQQYYQSGLISDGHHKLTVTHNDNNTFWIDYILFTPSSGTSPSGVSSHGSNNSGKKTNVGAIAGGVVGGVVVLIAALVAFYFLYWRRRRRNGVYNYDAASPREDIDPAMSEANGPGREPIVTPFTDATTQSHPSDPSAAHPSIYAGSSSYGAETAAAGSNVRLQNSGHGHSDSQSSGYPMSMPQPAISSQQDNSQYNVPPRKGARPLPPAGLDNTSTPRLHEDGGVRLEYAPPAPADPEVPMDVPPVYRQY